VSPRTSTSTGLIDRVRERGVKKVQTIGRLRRRRAVHRSARWRLDRGAVVKGGGAVAALSAVVGAVQ